MALQTSGSMSISDINMELDKSSSASLTTSDSDFLALGDKSAGQSISIPGDFYGKFVNVVTVLGKADHGIYDTRETGLWNATWSGAQIPIDGLSANIQFTYSNSGSPVFQLEVIATGINGVSYPQNIEMRFVRASDSMTIVLTFTSVFSVTSTKVTYRVSTTTAIRDQFETFASSEGLYEAACPAFTLTFTQSNFV